MAHDVVVGEHPRGRGPDAVVGAQRRLDDRAERGGVPVGVEEVEVERLVHLVGAHVAREPLAGLDPGLGAEDAVRSAVGVQHRAPAAVDLVHAVLVPHGGGTRRGVVEHVAVGGGEVLGVATRPGRALRRRPRRRARPGRPVRQPLALDETVRDVDPEAVDPAVAPEPEDVVELRPHVGVLPVQVGLGHVEDVQVPLARRAVGLGHALPAPTAEHRRPVVGGLLAAGTPAVTEDVAVALGAARTGGQRGLEPGVLAARVVRHEVDEHLEAQAVRGGDHRVGVGEGAEPRVDVAVVGHVVARVVHRGDVERAQPHRIHTEVAQVREAGGDAREVADPVAVGVGPRARVDLVDHGVAPPRCGGGVGLVEDLAGGGQGLGAQLGHRPHDSVCRAEGEMPPAPLDVVRPTYGFAGGSPPEREGLVACQSRRAQRCPAASR